MAVFLLLFPNPTLHPTPEDSRTYANRAVSIRQKPPASVAGGRPVSMGLYMKKRGNLEMWLMFYFPFLFLNLETPSGWLISKEAQVSRVV